jgi:uncharacterized tellurite resistance protein B-like protein
VLRTIKDLFDAIRPPAPGQGTAQREHALQLATGVLLVEVMRADAELGDAERKTIVASLREKFDLSDDELARLLDLAELTARDAHDLHSFTSRINEGFDLGEKVRMVEHMWRVAYADGHLDAHENHVMRRIADLLHVPHGAYVNAKMRARQSGGEP